MTEKRFTMAEDGYTIEDNSKIISVMTREDILFTLNRLNDENEQLKIQIESCRNQQIRQANKIHEILKENDELKQYKQAVSDILWDWYRKDGSLTIWRIMKELNVDGDNDD